MKRKKKNENEEPKPKKYKKKIENPEKQKVRYVYDKIGESGKIWEKNRRDRLNKTFEGLCALLPNKTPKMSKIDILSNSITFIEELKEKIEKIEEQLNNEDKDVSEKITQILVDASVETVAEIKLVFQDFEVQCDLDLKPKVECKETQTENESVSTSTNTENFDAVPLLSSSVKVTTALISTPIMTSSLYQPQCDKEDSAKIRKSKKKERKEKDESKENEVQDLKNDMLLTTQISFPLDTAQAKPEPSRYTIESLQQNSDKCRVRKNLMAELPLPSLQDNEIENEIIEALSVPHVSSNTSVSPTAAYLVSFPIVSSGKQIGEEADEPDKSKGENLNDSNTRTMLDLENLFPSHLFPSVEPALSPVTTSKKKITFDSPLKDHNNSNKPSLNFQKFSQYPKISEEASKKSPMKYSSNYYQIAGDVSRLTPPTYTAQYNQYNPSLFTTTAFNPNDRYIEQPSNFTFCLTAATKSDPKYTTSGKTQDYYPHMDKKSQPTYSPNTKYSNNTVPQNTKNRYPFYVDHGNLMEGSKTAKTVTTMTVASSSSCAKTTEKKRSCSQQQFTSKYDINWMTNSEFKSNTPDLSLLGSFDYFTQPSSHYTSSSLEMNRKSDMYFPHQAEENTTTWSPSKMAPNTLDASHFGGANQYFTPTLPNLHGDLALNPPQIDVKHIKDQQAVSAPNKKPNQETNFLSVQQLMNNNQPQKPPIRTKAEKKSMPSYCESNFESRPYNYSAEALINNSRAKPAKSFPDYHHIEPTAAFDDHQFYNNSNNKCADVPKTFPTPTPFMEPTNLYQPPCFSRTTQNFSYQETYNATASKTTTTYQKPAYSQTTTKTVTNKQAQVKSKTTTHKYQPYTNDYPLTSQESSYSYNQSSFNYPSNSKAASSYSFNIQGAEGFSNSSSRTIGNNLGSNSNNVPTGLHHQNTTGSLTNFNVSTIFPEINEKVRQQNW